MNKKGAILSSELVVMISVILGAIFVALWFFGFFDNGSLTERETCGLSILSRATVPSVVQQGIPLSCFTEKVCITTKEGFLGIGGKDNECEQFSGDENVRTVYVKVDGGIGDVKAVDTIQREVANAMFDCWIMAGQGKLDIFNNYKSKDAIGLLGESALEYTNFKIPEINTNCIVCSRVAFSDSLIEADKNGFLDDIDYNAFMSREKVPGSSLTYFQAFTDESVGSGYGSIGGSESLSKYFGKTELDDSDIADIKNILELQFRNQPEQLKEVNKMFEDESKVEQKLISYLSNLSKPVSSDQIAVVFTQIKVPAKAAETQYWDTFQNGVILGGVAAISGPGKIASYLLPGPGWLKLLYKIGTIGAVSYNLASDAEKTTEGNQALAAATCGDFQSTIGQDEKGCSLVKLVNWNANTINSLCADIEGNL